MHLINVMSELKKILYYSSDNACRMWIVGSSYLFHPYLCCTRSYFYLFFCWHSILLTISVLWTEEEWAFSCYFTVIFLWLQCTTGFFFCELPFFRPCGICFCLNPPNSPFSKLPVEKCWVPWVVNVICEPSYIVFCVWISHSSAIFQV